MGPARPLRSPVLRWCLKGVNSPPSGGVAGALKGALVVVELFAFEIGGKHVNQRIPGQYQTSDLA